LFELVAEVDQHRGLVSREVLEAGLGNAIIRTAAAKSHALSLFSDLE
jgi:hypothetical protein